MPLLPYSRLVIFWGSTLISTFSVQTDVFMAKACFGLRLVLRQNNWRRFSPPRTGSSTGIMSFPRCAGLLYKGKITQDLVNMLMSWRHSGFNVYCGPRIQPGDDQAMENLARYIIRASFSQDRMTYIPEDSKVVYQSKDGKEEKIWVYPSFSKG